MKTYSVIPRWLVLGATVLAAGAFLAGCPQPPGTPESEYDRGFDDGFALDEWYWDGYWDGYDTLGSGPIYYEGGQIPYIDNLSYDAGFWDGVWYAYNDGYFVNYHYAFIIGFSEGYDATYGSGWYQFLLFDNHVEYGHGGWSDGYNDGFSEGRVFGAEDYLEGFSFDWLAALLDYEDGYDADLYPDLDLGTGALGPVVLYQYGTDPLAKMIKERGGAMDETAKSRLERAPDDVRSIRREAGPKGLGKSAGMFRSLTSEAANELNVFPDQALRGDREIQNLDQSWLERINAYMGYFGKGEEAPDEER